MRIHTDATARLAYLVGCSLVALIGGSCSHSPSSTGDAPAPTLGAKMASSPDADAVIARARKLTVKPTHPDLQAMMTKVQRRPLAATPSSASSALVASTADAAFNNGNMIRAHLPAAKQRLEAALPLTSDRARTLKLPSGGTIALQLKGATAASAEFASGYVVYRGALGGGDVIVRPSADGFEDHVLFDKRPDAARVDYTLKLPPDVAGLRLSGNIVELVDKNGTPLVHASQPFLVDSAGKSTKAKLSITGCAFDQSTQPTWHRTPTAPGATSCGISVTWDDINVKYPALLDPTWEAASAMPVAATFYNYEILAGRTPQQIVVFSFSDSATGAQTTTLFFDVDSGTWSVGPPTVLARLGGASVSFNNANTNDGAQVFVSGGYNAQFGLESSTETLSLDANGQWAWKASAPMQSARFAHTATAIPATTGAQILLAGGYGIGPYANGCDPGPTAVTAELYDTASGSFVSPAPPNLPSPAFYATANLSADGQAVIIMGGYNGGVDEPGRFCSGSSTVLAFRGGQWLTLPSPPSYRITPKIVRMKDGRLLVTDGGGYGDATQQTCVQAPQTEIFTYSPAAPYGSWTTADPVPTGSAAGALVTLSNGAVLFGPVGTGGACDTPPTPTTQVDLFDPQTGHWSRIADTAQPHYEGGLVSVVKSTGENEAVAFGGYTAYDPTAGWTHTATTETLTLAPNGQPCTINPECANGTCVGGTCQPPGFAVTIDATALSNKGLAIAGYATTPIDTTQPRAVNLAAGTYTLQPYTGPTSVATFTVKSDGTIDYDPSLEGLLNGRGSRMLKVNGRTITVDATPLAQPQLALLAYHYQAGAEVDQLPFPTNTQQSFTLLPLTDFGYQFDVDGNHLTAFTFNLDLAGNVLIPSDELILARGSGGTLLRLGGAHVSITVPTGLGSATLGGGITIPEGGTADLQLLPYAAGSTMTFTIAGQTTTLTVNSAGYVDGDPLLLHVLGIKGDGSPLCDAQDAAAEAGGWDYTQLNCAGPSSQTANGGAIDAPALSPTVTARITGAGRPPSMLPRNRRAAGGDPVLGDGEFTIDRTDASLAGLGIHYEFHRTYRSGNQMDSPLGSGWDHNYDQRILGKVIGDPQSPDFQPIFFGDEIATYCDGTVQYQDGAGDVILFSHTRWAYDANGIVEYFVGPTPDLALEFHLSFSSPLLTNWRLVRNDGQVTTFDRAGFLSSIADPAGNSLTFGWARATPPAPPIDPHTNQPFDCAGIGYSVKECSNWLYGLMRGPIGQRRRLVWAADVARTVYYVYSQTDTEHISTNDRLACISLSNNCNTEVLASFTYDSSPLKTVRHGAPTAAVFETYAYHAPSSDVPYCHPNAEISDYCHRLCDDPAPGHCDNQGYNSQVLGRCAQFLCEPQGSSCDDIFEPFPIRRGTGINAPSICCTGYQVGDPTICRQFLWDGPDCITGCENEFQCTKSEFGDKFAAYAGGVGGELTNDITDVYDNKGQLVVHNVYGEDRTLVSFDKVVSQTLGSASTDNTITFEYHDLAIEALPDGAPVYNDVTGYPKWPNPYSTPDPNVQQYQRDKFHALNICPTICGPGGVACAPYDYGPAVEVSIEINTTPMSFATVIHDLHGLNRIQYMDPDFNVLKEVTLETADVTEFNYIGGLLRGVLAPSGMRTCLERDAAGRVTQSSTVAAVATHPNGTNITQSSIYTHYPNGQLSDEFHDIFGHLTRTHYERDSASRVIRIDQDVNSGVQVHTYLEYTGETLPAGILEEPTKITYPNQRQDKFSQFDPSLGGFRSLVVDATNATPENRYAVYDSFGRVSETGEVGRYAQHFGFTDTDDIWRLTSTGHRPDSTKPWVDTTVASHVVNGATVVDSVAEPLRTTNFTTVGPFPTQKDLVATVAPTGSTPPSTQTSCYNYAPDGRIDAMILPEGNSVAYTYQYRPTGNVVVTTKGFGNVDTSNSWAAGCRGKSAPPNDPGLARTAVTYQPGGFISGDIDENLVGRVYTTDGFGRVISIASAQNPSHPDPVATQQFGYDVAGHRIWVAERTPGTAYGVPSLPDPTVLSYSQFDYDLAGRVTQERAYVIETGDVLVKTYSYDDVAGSVTITDRGAITKTVVDGRGRMLSLTQPDNSVTSIVHGLGVDTATIQSNSKGNIVRVYNYDTRGLLTNVATSTGQSLYGASYDDNQNQQTETRAGMGPTTWVYDSFDRLVSETRTITTTPTAVSATSLYSYDRNDRVTKYFDEENSGTGGVPWTLTLSGADAPLQMTDPVGRTGVYTYSADPNWPHTLLATVQEPNGRVTSYGYDSQARVIDLYNGYCGTTRDLWTCATTPLTSQRHFSFDSRGNVAEIDAPSPRPSVYFTYDSLGRVINDQVGTDTLVHHSYPDQGRSQQSQVSHGTAMATMTHRFDAMGRIHTVELSGQTSPLATYDFGVGAGGPLSLAYSNGATATYTYDDKLRQTGIDVNFKKFGQTNTTFLTSLHEALGADSIPRLRQHKTGTKAPTTDVFQVDLDGRVTGENLLQTGIVLPSGEVGNTDPVVALNIQKGTAWRAYDLDKIDNIKQRRTKSSTLVYTVDKLSRLTALGGTTVNRDSTDNLKGKQGDPVQFTFDQFTGTVTTATSSAATSTFVYDALDRRRSEHRSADNSDHIYVWDGNKLVGHGTPSDVALDVPGDDIDSHVVTIDQMGAGSAWFYHQGPDQSTIAVTGINGPIETYTYSAFGELTIFNGTGTSIPKSSFGNIFQFQGQVFDEATATYSMRARQYQPAWGRFLSPDPLSFGGGPSLYAFTGSRPLQQRDPSGLLPETWNSSAQWMREWMSTWSPFPGAAGQAFLFAPTSKVEQDLKDETLAQLNALAGEGVGYTLENGELHEKTYLTAANPTKSIYDSESGKWAPQWQLSDTVIGTVVAGRLNDTDRVTAESTPEEQQYRRDFASHVLNQGLDFASSYFRYVTEVVNNCGCAADIRNRYQSRTEDRRGLLQRSRDSAELGRNMAKGGVARPAQSAAHHIVAAGDGRASFARSILKKFGIGVNDAVNGVFLPATKKSLNPAGAAVHSTIHSEDYYQAVNEMLAGAKTRAQVVQILHSIGEALQGGGFP